MGLKTNRIPFIQKYAFKDLMIQGKKRMYQRGVFSSLTYSKVCLSFFSYVFSYHE